MNISVEVDSFRTISRWVFSLGKSWFRKRLWFWARCDFFIVEILIFLWQYQNSVLIPGFASNQILDSWLENNNYFIVSGWILWLFGNLWTLWTHGFDTGKNSDIFLREISINFWNDEIRVSPTHSRFPLENLWFEWQFYWTTDFFS